ncbi:MAG: TolC family protein [Planctomycetota bacterium]
MWKFFLWSFLGVLLCIGCNSVPSKTHWPEVRPLGQEFKTYQAPETEYVSLPEAFQEPTDSLTLAQALSYTLLRHPELIQFALEIRAKEAATLQASLFPNPEMSLEVEDFGGRDNLKGFKGSETTLQISQLFPLGGKIDAQTQVASLEQDLSAWDYEAKRLEILTQSTKAFLNVLESQEQLKLSEEKLILAQQIFKIISAKVEAGKVAPVEGNRAKIPLAESEFGVTQAQQNLQSSRKRLSVFWGNWEPHFSTVLGDFYQIQGLPLEKELFKHLADHPEIARFSVEKEKYQSILKWENAKSIPDLRVDAGVRYSNAEESQSFMLGVSVPLPLFDRNQGAISEARHRFSQVQAKESAIKLKLLSELSEYYQELANAYQEILSLKEIRLPQAETSFKAVSAGYQQGKFSYLEILDTQSILFEMKSKYIEALKKYHRSLAEIEFRIAKKIPRSNEKPQLTKGTNS